LDGSTGNDTYLFGRGSGKDTINSYDTTAGKLDVVQLGAGITPADVLLTRSGDELVLSIVGSSDSLRVQNQFNATNYYRIEQIRFADGTTWDTAAIDAAVTTGTSGNDALTGYAPMPWPAAPATMCSTAVPATTRSMAAAAKTTSEVMTATTC
uniref:calcium-binding protein n=1 Tax=Methylibium rhizosphaerae TaxID=2570323 RepID=UPI0015E398AC